MTEFEQHYRTLKRCLAALKGAVATIENQHKVAYVSDDQFDKVTQALYDHLPAADTTKTQAYVDSLMQRVREKG